MTEGKKQKVVVIGHGYLSRLSIIRSVAEIGCEVSVIVMVPSLDKRHAPRKPIDCYSKYVKEYFFCSRQDIDSLIPLLLEKCTDPGRKVVLIPDGDDVVAAIDNHKDVLREHFLFPRIINEPTSMEYWMDKTHQKQLAREFGLNVTKATVIDIVDGQYTIPKNIKYPCFSKPLATMNGGKGGMRRCDNAEDLAMALNYLIQFKSRNLRVLVEDFKEIGTEYALLGFSDGQNVVIPALFKLLVVSKKMRGIALRGEVFPTNDFEELIDKFKKMALKMGFVGVFDIDFYESWGVFYFCEMNLRYGGSGYAVTKMGVNLPAMMVKSFTGDSIAEMNKSISGRAIYLNDRMCLEDYSGGFISQKTLRNYRKSADIRFISDAADKAPERAYNRQLLKSVLVRFVKDLVRTDS